MIDNKKFCRALEELQEQANREIINLILSSANREVIFLTEDDIDEYGTIVEDGSGKYILLYAYKVDEEGRLLFKAKYTRSGKPYQEGEWCDFEDEDILEDFHRIYRELGAYFNHID